VKQYYWLIILLLFIGFGNFSAEPVAVSGTILPKTALSKETLFVLDHFEDGDYLKNPTWWVFGPISLSVGYNTADSTTPFVQKRSLVFRGEGSRYVGGAGMYYPKDLSSFEGMRLVLWGNGPDSGYLQIQLFDDDNGNFVVETFPDLPNTISKDDRWLHTLRIDWQGWKEVLIPFTAFHDGNPGIGDGKWNPKQEKGSGGFLQLQLVAMTTGQNKPAFFKLDSIGFVKGYQFPSDTAPKGDILEEPSFQENIDTVSDPRSSENF
jgi:hypothetical protein